MQAVKGSSMDKWLCWSALSVSGLFLLLFLCDFIFSFTDLPLKPFSGMDTTLDILGVLTSGVLVYLSFSALREMR